MDVQYCFSTEQILLLVLVGEQGGLNLPLPLPFNPGSRPVFVGCRLFAFLGMQNTVQCCVMFPFFSRFLPPQESRFPPPRESRFPPPRESRFPPPRESRFPPPLLPLHVTSSPPPPPVPLHILSVTGNKGTVRQVANIRWAWWKKTKHTFKGEHNLSHIHSP